jgi:hypothetical protein
MVYRGKVQGGVVILSERAGLAEGTEVVVVPQAPPGGASGQGPSIWDALSQLGHWVESQPSSLPGDLAANHDNYLHGSPKRQ